MQPCPTCGRHVTDLAAHNAEMVSRRARYGKTWDLAPTKRLVVVADDSDRPRRG